MGRRLSWILHILHHCDMRGNVYCCGAPRQVAVVLLAAVTVLSYLLLPSSAPDYSETVPSMQVLQSHWNVSQCGRPVPLHQGLRASAGEPRLEKPKRQLIVVDNDKGTCTEPGRVDAGTCFLQPGSRDKAHCLPSVVIAGTQKASTDLLRDVLSKHPNVHMGGAMQLAGNFIGEMHFFDNQDEASVAATWWDDYLPYFEPIQLGRKRPFASDIIMMEKTPKYMADPPALTSMHFLVPSVKLIVLLRDPVGRTYSGFQHTCKKNKGSEMFGSGKKGTAVATVNLWAFYAGLGSPCSPEQFHAYITGKAQRNGQNRTAHSLEKEASRGANKDLYLAWEALKPTVNITAPPREKPGRALDEGAPKPHVRSTAPEVQRSLYGKQLKYMLSLFPARNLCVIVHEKFRSRNEMIEELVPLQRWAGLPQFDYESLLNTAKDGGVYVGPISYWSTHSRLSGYKPMLDETSDLLRSFFALPNKALWGLLDKHNDVTVLPREALTDHPW